ncbi:Scarecrow-like protein 23 [Raphanus sativus]|uniref:Scarecrow-like protein 23 n=1 Tax=Raphanus sativus TaxID=3726 RepID=A0A6J0MZY6_RAPSA|nr:scarecrow-like protein 23 [Raphanus sativus]KAJ4902621.1 Scarecrow-like protein 23 [Raphanus sativus]
MASKRVHRDHTDLSTVKRHKDLDFPENTTTTTPDAINLLSLLLQCAEYVATNHLHEASILLSEISETCSPFGSSPERVVAYFSQALQARVVSTYLSRACSHLSNNPPIHHPHKIFAALQTFNSLSPLIKFSHFTANQAIFQALNGEEDSVHIIDLDVMQGLQWPGLFHILASRPRKLRSIRITGFGPSSDILASTGRRLADFAASLSLPFEFHPVVGKIGKTDPSRLGTRPGEAVVVHWMQHRLYDVTGSDLDAVEVIRGLRPSLVTMVEQELSCDDGGGCFLGRFVEALHYYSALFDALGDGLGEESGERFAVEQIVLATEIRNIVGEKKRGMMRWREELSRVGFRPVSLRGNPATQAGLLLGMLPWNGYTLVEENGTLRLGWKDLSLLTASAWQSQPSD